MIADRARLVIGLQRLRPTLPVIILAGLLALLPFPTCLLRLALHIPCPACGLTRATLALLHLDLHAAMGFHPLAPALALLAALTCALAFVASDTGWRRLVAWVTGAAGVALIVVWVLRFAGLFGGPVAI